MRNPDSNKYDYGHALLVAGSHGMMGCALLAARAALRSGCGLLTVHLPSKCVDPMQAALPEAIVSIDQHRAHFGQLPLGLDRFDALAVGPGLGLQDGTKDAVGALLQGVNDRCQVVLDADALTIFAHRPDYWRLLDRFESPAIITPHDGEYRRLFGIEPSADVAKLHRIVVVRKGHHSRVFAPDGSSWECAYGNAGMATAGSGDVLTGILLGLGAQHRWSAFETACKGVEIHAKSGDLAVEKQSEDSLIASDLVENLKFVSVD